HSRGDILFLVGIGENITIPMIADFEVLNWEKDKGIFVLHTCRSGRFEESLPGANGEINYSCIAGEFSKRQGNKTIGQ
ncbi:hypothetical protein OFN36_32455, partial [Escherichia coli]|nr:hypothetical protein [Escherichia coli]